MNKLKRMLNIKMLWIAILGLVLLKYGYYGFRYYPVIDDWIQYGGYSLYNDIFRDVILRVGTYTTRPLASLSDPYIWGQLWGNMWIAFFIMTLLHFVSAWLLYKVFEYNRLTVGMVFLVIYLLLPLGTEATYWISASSRIVVGTFFMALSLYFLSLYIDKYLTEESVLKSPDFRVDTRSSELRAPSFSNNIFLAAFAFTHLVSFGYYEQVIILSFVSALVLIAANWSRLEKKWIAAIPFVNLFVIGAYYKIFGNTGNLAQRGQVVDGDYLEHFSKVMDKISDVWGRAHLPLYSNGFKRGLSLLISNHSYFYLILMVLFSILACLHALKEKPDSSMRVSGLKVLLGLILFWAPFGVNFFLKDIWISNRNAFTSFIGLGLIAEGAINAVSRTRVINTIKSLGVFAAVFIFLVVNISELSDYKSISQIDKQICGNVISAVKDRAFFEGAKEAVVFGTLPKYIEQNSYFHEHIHNVTESDWAFTGGVRAVAGNTKIKYVKPIHKWHAVSLEKDVWEKYIVLGIDRDLKVFPLTATKRNNGDVLLSKVDGGYFGELKKQDDEVYVLEMP